MAKLEVENEHKKEEIDELQGIYDYQLSINDDLNGKIEELEKQLLQMEQERSDQAKQSQRIADSRAKMKQEAALKEAEEAARDVWHTRIVKCHQRSPLVCPSLSCCPTHLLRCDSLVAGCREGGRGVGAGAKGDVDHRTRAAG